MICTNPECQTTAGCKCRKTVDLNLVSPWPTRRLRPVQFGPCDQCAEYQDLQRAHENRELELLRKIETLVIERERFRFEVDGLRERVKHLGDVSGVCTIDDTKEICANCACPHRPR